DREPAAVTGGVAHVLAEIPQRLRHLPLLISALIIFPALSAMRLFKSFKSVIVCSAVTSVLCAALGIIASILFSTPVGSTIVCADLAVFIVFSLISAVKRR
ncbi:MAG: metal ABC transporter permease, partial [Ruminococcus sp.]|nr:metal ABC transporter permease [Ruminococcus sp.]